jgi:hypothetical protein
MPPDDHAQRIILSHASPEAFTPMALTIMSKLGYAILSPEEFAESAEFQGLEAPALRIVDERSLPDVPEDGYSSIPIIVLTGRHGVTGADPRIAGAVRRPAGMHELYRLIQEVLEDTPRATPRILTHLPARCAHDGKEWTGAVLSLSESGCLLRSAEPQMLGSRFVLSFSLPPVGEVEVEADVSYQLIPDLGVTFHATSPADRETIGEFIRRVLVCS